MIVKDIISVTDVEKIGFYQIFVGKNESGSIFSTKDGNMWE